MAAFLTRLTAGVTANRLLTFSTTLVSLGASFAAVGGAFPVGETQQTIIAAAGLFTALGNTLNFQRGSQKYDALTAAKPTSAYGETGADLAFIDDLIPEVDPDDPAQIGPDVEQDETKVAP